MKFKNVYQIAIASMICLLSFSSCTKDDLGWQIKEQFIGSWTETPQFSSYSRVIYFGRDDSFTMQSIGLGTSNYASTFTGTYQISDNKLSVKIDQLTTQEGNKAPVTVKNTGELFEKATYSIQGNILTIDFITYPADGPVPTRVKFIKN